MRASILVSSIASLVFVSLCAPGVARAQAGAAAPPAAPSGKLQGVFKPLRPFYDVSGPLELAVRLVNTTGAPLTTGGTLTLDNGIVIKDKAGNVIPKTGDLDKEGRKVPDTVAPKEILDRTVDLRAGYPGLTQPGVYMVSWEDPRIDVKPGMIRIAPKYEKDKDYTVTFDTSMGSFAVELYKDKAPNHVSNFVQLAACGFYDGLTFHRVIDGFMIQGGDPKGDGTGDAGYRLKLEVTEPPLKHEKGTLAMARSGDPNSASCQFYVCLGPQPSLDGKYTVFGHVTSGMDTVEAIGKVKTSGPPADKPLSPVTIKKATVTVKGAASTAAATTGAAPAPPAASAPPAAKKP